MLSNTTISLFFPFFFQAVLTSNFTNASVAGCYESLSESQKTTFLTYEQIVGGYCNCIFGALGLLGNAVSLVVLSQKEMQKNNCFSKLLMGEKKLKYSSISVAYFHVFRS